MKVLRIFWGAAIAAELKYRVNFFIATLREMKSHQIPAGSFGIPILGETLFFVFDRDFAKKRYRQYGFIFKTHLLDRPTVVMVGPEALEFVLLSQMKNFSWREGWPDNFKTLLGESLFLQDGEEHRRNRRLMMPALHGPALANYVSTMEDITRSYLQKWQRQQEFTWFPEFKQLTFDILYSVLNSTSAHFHKESENMQKDSA
ncbi:cytochrome P450 [Nostoc sp.]|uniref:cytochrome P450 n=1 Tax=Nostoc sp. TaxID=1180 RepID=UPI002FFD5084